MKRTTVSLFCIALSALVLSQSKETSLFSTVTQQWDEGAGLWINDTRKDFRYDSGGQVVEELWTRWDEEINRWTPPGSGCYGVLSCFYSTGKILKSYDGRGNMVVNTTLGWDTEAGDWIDLSREVWEYRPDGLPAWHEYHRLQGQFLSPAYGELTEFSYDGDGMLVREERSRYDTEDGFWVPNSLYEMTVQEEAMTEVVLYSVWDEFLGDWVLERRSDSLYNAMGRVTNSVGYGRPAGTEWIPEDSASIFYNEQGLPVEEDNYYSNDLTVGEWFNWQKIFRSYTSEGQPEEKTEFFCDGWTGACEWSGGMRYRYDAGGLLLQRIQMQWSPGTETWTEVSREEWTYDSLQRVITETSSFWLEEQGNWATASQIVHTYDDSGNQIMVTTSRASSLPDGDLTQRSRELSFWAPRDSDPVIFTDPGLLEALKQEGVDTDSDGLVSHTEAESVTRLDITDYGITSLDGLDAFVHLDTLLCGHNALNENDLYSLPWLTFLDCSGCGLHQLDVERFPDLKSIICSHNEIEELDLTACPQLRFLDLSGMPDLREVCVWELPFPPEGVTVITGGSPRIHFTGECALNFPDHRFYEALIEAGADLNGDSLIHAAEAAAVTELDISGKFIMDVTGLEYFNHLLRLDCSYNFIYRLDLEELPELQVLSCGGTGLGTLDISHLSDLEYLDCSDLLSLKTLDLSGNPLLSTLICADDRLESIDLAGCNHLTYLDLGGNPLTRIDLTGNKELTYIDISDMPELREVCVWQLPFPPSGVEVRSEYSLQIRYNTECMMEQDRFENNDTRLEAVPLTDNVLFEGLTVSVYDDDWYELVPGGETLIDFLIVECLFSNVSGDINLEILNGSGKILAGAESQTDDERIAIRMNPMERYYLHVGLDSGQVNTYSLSWTSRVYTTNSSISLCLPGKPCRMVELTPSLRDTVYVTDTLDISLYSGDTVRKSITLDNYGPDSYSFYTALRSSGLQDDRNFALQFDGVDDRLDIQRYSGIDLKSEITLEAWIKPHISEEVYEPIISRSLNGYGYELFREQVNGYWKVGFRMDNGQVISEKTLEPDRWTHVAVTYDSDAIRLYFDGEKDASAYVPGTISVVNQYVVVGANSPVDADPGYFSGAMDEVRIWSVARSYPEIKADYQQGLDGDETGLEAYFTLDESYPTVAVDKAGGTRGIIEGGALPVSSDAPVIRMARVNPSMSFITNGSVIPLTVTADAQDLRGGVYRMELHLNSNVEEHPDIVVPIRLRVTDASSISIEPDRIDFGDMEIYQTDSRELQVFNHGTRDLILDSLWTNVDGTRITPATYVIPPGGSQSFRMDAFFRFEGIHSGSVLIPSNDPTEPAISVPVLANAIPASRDVLLRTIDEEIRSGYFKALGLKFDNPSEELACPMDYTIRYLSMPDLRNDRFLQPDTGNWLFTNLPEDWIMLPPGGSLRFSVVLDASNLRSGAYFGEIVLEWYSVSKVRGFIPIRLRVNSTSVEKQFGEGDELVLYPNPTAGMVTLVTGEIPPFLVTVTSLTGQVMEQIMTKDQEVRLDLSFLEKGIYLVSIRTSSGLVTRRLVRY